MTVDRRDTVRGLVERAAHEGTPTPEAELCWERAEQIAEKHGLGLYLAVMSQPDVGAAEVPRTR